ncbi:MAG: 30S ribosomal protein S6 [Chloroflexota bacterium]
MRRYECMLVFRPDVPDDRLNAVVERLTRQIGDAGGQIVKVAPWGRRRLAYPIEHFREGSYHIVLFDAPPDAIIELERSLLITEEVLRHLITRVERPVQGGCRRARRGRGGGDRAGPAAGGRRGDRAH